MLLTTGCPVLLPVSQKSTHASCRRPSNKVRAVAFRPAKLAHRHALRCRADDGNSAVTDIRKIDTEKGGLTHTLRETVFTPESLVPVALGVGGAFLAGYGQDGAVIGNLSCQANCMHVRESACQTDQLHGCISTPIHLQVLRLEPLCGLDNSCFCNRQSRSPTENTPCYCRWA